MTSRKLSVDDDDASSEAGSPPAKRVQPRAFVLPVAKRPGGHRLSEIDDDDENSPALLGARFSDPFTSETEDDAQQSPSLSLLADAAAAAAVAASPRLFSATMRFDAFLEWVVAVSRGNKAAASYLWAASAASWSAHPERRPQPGDYMLLYLSKSRVGLPKSAFIAPLRVVEEARVPRDVADLTLYPFKDETARGALVRVEPLAEVLNAKLRPREQWPVFAKRILLSIVERFEPVAFHKIAERGSSTVSAHLLGAAWHLIEDDGVVLQCLRNAGWDL